jgi:hypothetical protein
MTETDFLCTFLSLVSLLGGLSAAFDIVCMRLER